MSMRYKIDLKRERIEHGYTQLRLAEHLGVSEKAISKWESGRGQPSYENMLKICELYDKDIEKVDTIQIRHNIIINTLNITMIVLNVVILMLMVSLIMLLKISKPNVNPSGDANLYMYINRYNNYEISTLDRHFNIYGFLLFFPLLLCIAEFLFFKKKDKLYYLFFLSAIFYLVYSIYIIRNELTISILIVYITLTLATYIMYSIFKERRRMIND